jgi:hypothetical protein
MFVLQPPRHPLARLALALLGLAVFAALLVFGLIALAVMIGVGAVLMLVRAWRNRHASGPPSADPPGEDGVIEGEYVIIHEHRDRTHS